MLVVVCSCRARFLRGRRKFHRPALLAVEGWRGGGVEGWRGGGVGGPPSLSHAGKNAMLVTKTSFEDAGHPPPSEAATTESGNRNGRCTADSSYPSAVGSPIGDYEVTDAEDGNGNGGREGWGFSPVVAATTSSPSM